MVRLLSGWCEACGGEEVVDESGAVLHAFEAVLGGAGEVGDGAGGEVGQAAA